MSWATVNYGYWEFWSIYDPANSLYGEQKCIFDGENKLIYVNPEVSSISVQDDIYSGWKEWTLVRDNSKYLDAIRTTGGDPIGGGSFSGDLYFLINGWRIILNHSFNVDGVLFSDDFPSPYIQEPGTFLVATTVSALVQTVGTGGGSTITADEVWTHPTRTLTATPAYNGPTTAQIASAVWTDSLAMQPEDLWAVLMSTSFPAGSAGEKLKQSLTIANFLALK